MAEYIEREAVIDLITRRYENPEICTQEISSIPVADVAPVRHGRWLGSKHKIFSNTYDYVCSKCGCDYALAKYNYCPNCGAKMDGVDDE